METEKVINHYKVKKLSRFAFYLGVVICLFGFIQLCYHCLFTTKITYTIYLPLMGAVLSGFAASVFITLWKRVQKNHRNDIALICLAGAMIVWGIMGLDWGYIDPYSYKSKYSDIASSANNYFLLSALYFFEHGGPNYRNKFLKFFRINKDNYLKRVLLVSLVIAISVFILKTIEGHLSDGFAVIIDLVFSTIVGVGLVIGLWKSFNQRSLGKIGLFSSITIVLALLAQLLSSLSVLSVLSEFDFMGVEYKWMERFSKENWKLLTSVILLLYKILLIFIFGALATSWLFSKRMENVVFHRQDMLHMAKNSIDNFIFEYKKLLKESESKREDKFSAFYKENLSRVVALRELYELLYTKESVELKGSVNLHKYLNNVITNVKSIYKPKGFKSAIHLGGLPFVRADSAVDLAKIIVESMTNSFKHGDGVISFKCTFDRGNSSLIVKIEDHGLYRDNPLSRGFGLKAIDIYLKNLNGEKIIKHTKNGTEFKYVFITLEKFKYYDRTNIGG